MVPPFGRETLFIWNSLPSVGKTYHTPNLLRTVVARIPTNGQLVVGHRWGPTRDALITPQTARHRDRRIPGEPQGQADPGERQRERQTGRQVPYRKQVVPLRSCTNQHPLNTELVMGHRNNWSCWSLETQHLVGHRWEGAYPSCLLAYHTLRTLKHTISFLLLGINSRSNSYVAALLPSHTIHPAIASMSSFFYLFPWQPH